MNTRISSRAVLRLLIDGKAHLTRSLADSLSAPNDSVAGMCRCLKKRGLILSMEGLHSITPLGREVLAGKLEPCKAKIDKYARSLRHRAWQAMHMLPLFTVNSLLEIIATGEEQNGMDNLRTYLKALHSAGLILRTKTGKYLLTDAAKGPHAPTFHRTKKLLTDRNRGMVFHV